MTKSQTLLYWRIRLSIVWALIEDDISDIADAKGILERFTFNIGRRKI